MSSIVALRCKPMVLGEGDTHMSLVSDRLVKGPYSHVARTSRSNQLCVCFNYLEHATITAYTWCDIDTAWSIHNIFVLREVGKTRPHPN
jgi:hypothetical protein